MCACHSGAAPPARHQLEHSGSLFGIYDLPAFNLVAKIAREGSTVAQAAVANGTTGFPTDLNSHIVFLGTGSAEPSKLRGSSGILLVTPSLSSLLLDCGEGTLNHMVCNEKLEL